MKYKNIISAIFIDRPNRFIARCEIDGSVEICHVKNTGRCKELLIPGADVFVQKADNPNRATKYDLISVQKGNRLINMDSQAPNKVFAEWLTSGRLYQNITLIKPETFYGGSRLDFYVETDNRKIYIEVKGVTLEENGVVLFPDAPTERGVKHLRELCDCVRNGFEAMAVFIIQMEDVRYFTPNDKTHAAFGEALRDAQEQGVRLLAIDCLVTPDSITTGKPAEIRLKSDSLDRK